MRSEFRLFAFDTGREYYKKGNLDPIRLTALLEAFKQKHDGIVPPSVKHGFTVDSHVQDNDEPEFIESDFGDLIINPKYNNELKDAEAKLKHYEHQYEEKYNKIQTELGKRLFEQMISNCSRRPNMCLR